MKVLWLLALVVLATADRKLLNAGWSFKIGNGQTMDADVPSCVHTDLLRQGQLKDPYYGANLLDAQWLETENSTYTMSFAMTPQ